MSGMTKTHDLGIMLPERYAAVVSAIPANVTTLLQRDILSHLYKRFRERLLLLPYPGVPDNRQQSNERFSPHPNCSIQYPGTLVNVFHPTQEATMNIISSHYEVSFEQPRAALSQSALSRRRDALSNTIQSAAIPWPHRPNAISLARTVRSIDIPSFHSGQ